MKKVETEIDFDDFLKNRGFKSGDIVIGYKGNVSGIIAGNNILWTSSRESDVLEEKVYKYIKKIIYVENITGKNSLNISEFLITNDKEDLGASVPIITFIHN